MASGSSAPAGARGRATRRERAYEAVRAQEEKGPGPELLAETIHKIATSPKPRLRYILGQQAKLVTRLRQFLPESAFEQGARRNFRLDG